MQLLPSSFRAMEVDLALPPLTLALLALCQGVATAVAGPFWGNLVDSGMSRKWLLGVGVAGWGICTMWLGCATRLSLMVSLRVMNGLCLSVLLPVVQSFVIDISKSKDRGYVFGLLYFSTNLGQVLACLFVTPLSGQTIWGCSGWRVALVVVGSLSLLVVLLVPRLVVDEPRPWRPDRLGLGRETRKFYSFLKIPSFGVLILQGIFGTIPGAAFAFITMYLQYIGISDFSAAMVIALHVIGDACGGLVGGMVGDLAAGWSAKYGRTMAGLFSVCSAVPSLAIIFLLVPREAQFMSTFAGLLFLHGLFSSWVAPGCICPIMCEIVPQSRLGSAYAWQLGIVFCSGNLFGPMLVGTMSNRLYGYTMTTEQIGSMPAELREQNARALGKSLFYSCAIPYAICALLLSLLLVTYQEDALRKDQLSDSDQDVGGGVLNARGGGGTVATRRSAAASPVDEGESRVVAQAVA